jgi:hypothetical protein
MYAEEAPPETHLHEMLSEDVAKVIHVHREWIKQAGTRFLWAAVVAAKSEISDTRSSGLVMIFG